MSKELEALKKIGDVCDIKDTNYYKIVESALIQAQKDKKELQDLKSAINKGSMIAQWSHDYQHEKELKALEIIKEKKVFPSIILETKNLEEYNINFKDIECLHYRLLTQEEFDLLKEVFK